MRRATWAAVVLAAAMGAGAGAAHAGTIERACLASDRPTSRALCGCIQKAANATLNGREQRIAAKFFSDPHRAQEMRTSSKSSDEQFWARYMRFGMTAESHCRG